MLGEQPNHTKDDDSAVPSQLRGTREGLFHLLWQMNKSTAANIDSTQKPLPGAVSARLDKNQKKNDWQKVMQADTFFFRE